MKVQLKVWNGSRECEATVELPDAEYPDVNDETFESLVLVATKTSLLMLGKSLGQVDRKIILPGED